MKIGGISGIGGPYPTRGNGSSRADLGASENFGVCLGCQLDRVFFPRPPNQDRGGQGSCLEPLLDMF